jgi:hypothetical protein
VENTLELLEGIEEELNARSFLFVDPISYRDGVEAATRAVRDMLVKTTPLQIQGVRP